MSPIHVLVWASAIFFQVSNATCLGSWLAAYGPTTEEQWAAQLSPYPTAQFALGASVFYLGLAANYYHDDELREIRRRETARQEREARATGRAAGVAKHYQIPRSGLFSIMLYPHYFSEWIEWTGFWIASGFSCQPAMVFVINEVAAMLPRAIKGKKWYEEKFGEEKVRGKWAVLPGIV